MRLLSEAIQADISEDYIHAASLYEQSLQEEGVNMEVITNLAVLYFEFTDYGFNAHYKIPYEIIDKGGDRYEQVLNEGLTLYPNSLELHFWKIYISSRIIYEPFGEEDVLNLISKYENDSLVPYFIAYMCNPDQYLLEREQLFTECKKQLTAKNRYMIAYLEK